MEQLQVKTADSIRWHVEIARSQNTEAEYIVLIPSGEGDCQSLVQVASILSTQHAYNVITFDMPGMSRTIAPTSAYTQVTPESYASQISSLLKEMNISKASMFGSSSGGITALALQAYHPTQVKCSIVHECAFGAFPGIEELLQQSDDKISQHFENFFPQFFIEEANDGRAKWKALGVDYHTRLAKNYVTWIRGFVPTFGEGVQRLAKDPELLQKRPVFWTVGGLNKNSIMWKENFNVAGLAGLKIDTDALQSLHFPSVTVPEQLVAWIDKCVKKAGES